MHNNMCSCNVVTILLEFMFVQAQDFNRSGNYTSAKQCGYMALGCNVAVISFYAIEILATIILLSVLLSYSS